MKSEIMKFLNYFIEYYKLNITASDIYENMKSNIKFHNESISDSEILSEMISIVNYTIESDNLNYKLLEAS